MLGHSGGEVAIRSRVLLLCFIVMGQYQRPEGCDCHTVCDPDVELCWVVTIARAVDIFTILKPAGWYMRTKIGID